MDLLTDEDRRQLLRNGELRRRLAETGEAEADFYPVVKLFIPGTAMIWLLTELDPEEPDIAFGLCDLGVGCPELGSVRVSELESEPAGVRVERDGSFSPNKTISAYAEQARRLGKIEA